MTVSALDNKPRLSVLKQRPLFTWDKKTRQYRKPNGRFIGVKEMTTLRRDYLSREQDIAKGLTAQLFRKDITMQDWYSGMRQQLTRTISTQFVLARGGRSQMTQRDWGLVGSIVKEQLPFLNNFSQQIADGNFTESQLGEVQRRAAMYANSANEGFSTGSLEAAAPSVGIRNRLPAVPGSGDTPCLTSCLCNLRIVEKDNNFHIFWDLSPLTSDHCTGCLFFNSEWRPFVLSKEPVEKSA